ncbi:MAG: protein phosphatase 2C domain-containing protein [Chloroflexi bacterium]|nr:protein phosphatase 2C domain-containing protein [Chloroflexota bacterium]MCC6895918.1 protein phosphatase 2C domain-containing protein [Anaerolineae bacterium]
MNQNITQQIQVVQRSEIGLKRNVNQDSIGVRLPQPGQSSAHALFIVADGVGGNLPKGEVASRTAVESMLAHYYAESDEGDMLIRVGDALQDTNHSVRQKATSEGVDNIGTTIVGFSLAPDGEAIGFNVGDSRLYRIRGGEIERISEDQVSLPEPGVLKDEFKPRRVTKISSYVGQPNMLEPNFYRLRTQVGDTYLLCSDGVWSKIPDEELLDVIDRQPLEQASERLVKLVYERNAPDNLSLVLVRLGPPKGPAAVGEPIGEMPTAILTPTDRGEKGGSKVVPILIGVGVVVAAAIGGIGLLSQQSNSSATPTALVTTQVITQMGLITATAEETESPTSTVTDEPEETAAPESTVVVAVVATGTPAKTATPRPSATPTEAPSSTPVPPTNTAEATATLKPSATATRTPTEAPTDEPTSEPTAAALVVPTETAAPTKAPTKAPSATPSPTDKPTAEPTATASVTPLPTRTLMPTTTLNPTLITYTPSPSPTPSETFTPTMTNTKTATATFTPSATLSNQQVESTGTAFARITPSPTPTLFAPQVDEVITLSQAVMFYPSRNGASFTLPDSGGIELPPDTTVRVVSNLAQPIDSLIYSYVIVEGETEQQGWAALAPAMQATMVAHLPAGVIIRRGPGQGYERVGVGLKDGERALILGKVTYKGQLWYYVDPENPQSQAGWVYSGVRDLELLGSVEAVPIRNTFPVEPTPLPTPTVDVIVTIETPTATP